VTSIVTGLSLDGSAGAWANRPTLSLEPLIHSSVNKLSSTNWIHLHQLLFDPKVTQLRSHNLSGSMRHQLVQLIHNWNKQGHLGLYFVHILVVFQSLLIIFINICLHVLFIWIHQSCFWSTALGSWTWHRERHWWLLEFTSEFLLMNLYWYVGINAWC
jgi:hypothetical protein